MVVVQLVERCIWDAEVVGSSPAYHTKMPRWWNGRHACLRNKYRNALGFESLSRYTNAGVVELVGTTDSKSVE